MPLAPTDIRSLARKYTEQAIETLVHVMRAPQAPPAARVLAANSLLDRGWGKAAQLVAVDGEIRQLVEVKLNVVQPGADRVIEGQLSAPSSPDLPQTERFEAISSDIKHLKT